MSDELTELDAVELAGRLRSASVSAAEVLEAHLTRIADVNPRVNAIVTLDLDAARERAARLDRLPASERGPLHGLPIAVKDLEDTAGMRTTYGSRAFADHVPDADTLLVARLREAGAIIVGKTNTPEFGAGSQTFNDVFGPTRNPYDLERTPGGSSGGAAAAVAAGMLPFADGSDMGGSVRNPASMCNLVGLRTIPGRIPDVPSERPWNVLSVYGPIARTVADAALLLSVLAGPDPRAPLSLLPTPDGGFVAPPVDPATLRIAFDATGGGLPIEPAVTETLRAARGELVAAGVTVQDIELDLGEVDFGFETLRALAFAARADLLRDHSDVVKRTLAENIRAGLALDGPTIARAQDAQAIAVQRMRTLLSEYDAVALPATQVAAFSIDTEYPTEIDGVPMHSYIEWMRACTRVTVTSHPAVSIPAGFTSGGLPVGLQLVGRFGDERGLLGIAAALEAATGHGRRRPVL